MAKRQATSVLNQENWDKEDEVEEPGIFQMASSEVLQARVIKTAKRRIKTSDSNSEEKPSPFLGFSGFGKTTTLNNESPFSFLKHSKTNLESNGSKLENSSTLTKNTASPLKSLLSSSVTPKKDNTRDFSDETRPVQLVEDTTFKPFEHIFKAKSQSQDGDGKKMQNLKLLRDLNLSCSSWIAEHLKKNPYCILTPIFKDYEKHLAEINLNCNEESADKVEDIQEKKKTDLENFLCSEESNLQSSKSLRSIVDSKGSETNKESNKNEEKDQSSKFKLPEFQLTKPLNFEFGSSNTALNSTSIFSLNKISCKPVSIESESKKDDEESEEPPKNEFVPVIEEDSIFDIKCKVFVKKEGNFVSRGVGTLFLKPVKDTGKTQLVVRAHTNLGNILLNILLTPDMPVQKTGKNNAMIVCIPTPESQPPPVPVLIRVKTSEECDVLIKKLEALRG